MVCLWNYFSFRLISQTWLKHSSPFFKIQTIHAVHLARWISCLICQITEKKMGCEHHFMLTSKYSVYRGNTDTLCILCQANNNLDINFWSLFCAIPWGPCIAPSCNYIKKKKTFQFSSCFDVIWQNRNTVWIQSSRFCYGNKCQVTLYWHCA